MEMPVEKFAIYHLSKKTQVIIKEGSRTVTISKRINPIMESKLTMNENELAMLFHVLNMRTLMDDAMKSIEKEDDHADGE